MLAITAAVVLVIVIAAVLAFEGHRSTATAGHPGGGATVPTVTPAQTTTPASVTTTAAAITPTIGTTPPASPSAALVTTVPTEAPPGVTWSLFQGVALPVSATDGPTKITGAVFAGYSHTPTGALLAAVQISTRHLLTAAPGWQQILNAQIVAGPGRDAVAKVLQAQGNDTSPPRGGYGQYTGFRFVTYAPDVAVIEVATKFSNGNQDVSTLTVRWSDGDWKQELQPNGADTPSVQQVQDLSGFIIWSGVS